MGFVLQRPSKGRARKRLEPPHRTPHVLRSKSGGRTQPLKWGGVGGASLGGTCAPRPPSWKAHRRGSCCSASFRREPGRLSASARRRARSGSLPAFPKTSSLASGAAGRGRGTRGPLLAVSPRRRRVIAAAASSRERAFLGPQAGLTGGRSSPEGTGFGPTGKEWEALPSAGEGGGRTREESGSESLPRFEPADFSSGVWGKLSFRPASTVRPG